MRAWGEGRGRWALAVALCCLSLLALAPAALGAGSPGQISGTVTKAGGSEAIEGIEVCAYGASAEFSGELEEPFIEHCAKTSASGGYTISELPSGEYDVEFLVPFESGLNYITQYYDDKPSFSEAQPVSVGAGANRTGIDAALQVGGEIKGTVIEFTESEDIVPLKNIEVTVYEASGKELPVGFATTKGNGEYTVAGLATNSYKIGFSPSFESGLNFVTQYYEGMSSLAAAKTVAVTQEQATLGINAELQVGGEVEGTVTDAITHVALQGIVVFASGASEASSGFAVTNASGQYTMLGLASGSYRLEFLGAGSGSPYIAQFYNDQPSLATANPVEVTQGSTTTGINAALVPKAPINTAQPTASGTLVVGQTLSCSNGTWTGSPTPTFTHLWLRNGSAIADASASTYVVQGADQGAGLACKVTATNKNGSASAVSNTLTVPAVLPSPPPPARPVAVIMLSSSKVLASRSVARVPIACDYTTCAGTIELTEQIVVKQRKGKKTISKKQTVVLAKGSYSLAAGKRATIAVRLTAAGKLALAGAKTHRLFVKAIVSVTGGAKVTKSVVLSQISRTKLKHE